MSGADTITVTRNEILYSLNKPDDFILAIVEVSPEGPPTTAFATCADRSGHRPPSIRYNGDVARLAGLLEAGEPPS